MKTLSFFSVFLAGVLLDIQQHFGVKDSGAGLLQTGNSIWLPTAFCKLPLLRLQSVNFLFLQLQSMGTLAVGYTRKRSEHEGLFEV